MAPTTSSSNNNSDPHKKQIVLATSSQKQSPQSGIMEYASSHHTKCIGRYHHHDHHDGFSTSIKPASTKTIGDTSYFPQSNKAMHSQPGTIVKQQQQHAFLKSKTRKNKRRCTSPECTFIHNGESNSVTSFSQHAQQTSNSIICCDEQVMRMMGNIHSPINLLKSKLIKKIFSYLNHSDLIQCRAVQTLWNSLISQDEHFIDKTVFVVNMHKSYNTEIDSVKYNDNLEWAKLPFRHGRLQYIDHHYYKEPEYFSIRNSDNERYFPSSTFLRTLTSLELRNSYVLWSTLKRILAKTTVLEELKVSNCHISDASFTSALNEDHDFTAGNTIFGLKTLDFYETRSLNNITKILKKSTGFNSQSLTTLKIVFYPPESQTCSENTKAECFDFCRELKALISMCANSLTVLILDIQHEPTLDLLGYHVGKELEALGSQLDLQEFQLSPPIGAWLKNPKTIPRQNVAMTMDSIGEDTHRCMKAAASSLARFLESQQNLMKLGMPCIEYPEAYSSCFRSVLQQVPCKVRLEELAIPCAGFLPDDFLHQFPRLKKLVVGASCCGDFTESWNAFKHYQENDPCGSQCDLSIVQTKFKVTKNQQFKSPEPVVSNTPTNSNNLMRNIVELRVSTVTSPENFGALMKSLCNLTRLEVNSGLTTPSLCDADLQACIRHLKSLKGLIVSCSTALTDYGITGIPEKHCQLMFKHQRYHDEGVNKNIWNSEKVIGRPLSDLTGLKTLILMGSNSFTDIGIGYGLAFKELQYCHLPYSDNITSWGITRFGCMNPSVESLIFSGANEMMIAALPKLRRTHARIMKGDSSRSGYFFDQESGFVDDISLILPKSSEILTAVVECLTRVIRAIVSKFYESNQSQRPTLVVEDDVN